MPDDDRGGGFNPLRNESDMFRVLLWFVAAVPAVDVIVLVIQAL